MMTMNRLILTLGLAAALGLGACGGKPKSDAKREARAVTVVAVSSREIEGGLTASGNLVPREDTAVFPQISGYRVAKVLADEGVWVKAGQPLLQLDDTLLRAQVAQADALAAQQAAIAAQAEAQAARVKGAESADLLSQEQIDARRYQARSARALADAQAAAARDVKTRQSMMVVRAPVSGQVIERNVRLGDMATMGGATPWYRIAKDGEVELLAQVNEESLEKLKPGQHARVSLADGSEIEGVIRLVSPSIDSASRLGKVRILLPVRPNVRAGGFARATFEGGTRSTLSVPESAVRYDGDGAAVLTVDANGKLSRVSVTTGVRGGGYVELLTGPAAGAMVVAKAAAMLNPGDLVKPVSGP
jgi:HlyD family secretion protein